MGCDLKEGIGVAPQERKAGEPVFCVDRLANSGKVLLGENADSRREFRASNFSPEGTGSDRSFRVVTNALALSGFAVSHEAESAIIFREPDRSPNGDSILTEGGKADIALTLNFAGNRRHVDIVKRSQAFLQPRDY